MAKYRDIEISSNSYVLNRRVMEDEVIDKILNEISELQVKLDHRIKEIREEFANEKVRDWCLREEYTISFGNKRLVNTAKIKINPNITFSELFENSSENDYACLTQRLGIRDLKEFKAENESSFYGFVDLCKMHYFEEIYGEQYFDCLGFLCNKAYKLYGKAYEERWNEVDFTYRNGNIYHILGNGDHVYIITNSDYEVIGTTCSRNIEDGLDSIGIL